MTTALPPVSLPLRTILTVTAIVLILLGGGLSFAPHLMAHLYGATETSAGTNATRMAGAAVLALGLLARIGIRHEARVVNGIVVPVLFVWFALKSVVAYSGLVSGVFSPPVGKTVFALDLALAAIYGYYFFKHRFWRKAQ